MKLNLDKAKKFVKATGYVIEAIIILKSLMKQIINETNKSKK